MVTLAQSRIPHLGYAPLGVVGLMLSKTSFHCPTPVDYSFGVLSRRLIPDPHSNSWTSVVGGLIVRVWFADDDLE
jgi:hypothetical protein